MGREKLESAIETLKGQYFSLSWVYQDVTANHKLEKILRWPGPPEDDILIVVHQCGGEQEPFHHHDFFYFNFTYKGEYDSLSYKYDNRITIREGELYAGQPFAGHALCAHDDRETVIIGVLIQKDTFFRTFLPMFSSNSRLFHFLIDPATNQFSDEYIHMKIENDCNVRTLLKMMVIEYADQQEDTQEVLRPLALAFLQQIARQYAAQHEAEIPDRLSDKIIQYISTHTDSVSLKEIAKRFSYNPNYISGLLHRETGRSFSEILLEQRMERAACLLRGTSLSVEEVASMLGYSNSSNFYKAFRGYYHQSPREFVE